MFGFSILFFLIYPKSKTYFLFSVSARSKYMCSDFRFFFFDLSEIKDVFLIFIFFFNIYRELKTYFLFSCFLRVWRCFSRACPYIIPRCTRLGGAGVGPAGLRLSKRGSAKFWKIVFFFFNFFIDSLTLSIYFWKGNLRFALLVAVLCDSRS